MLWITTLINFGVFCTVNLQKVQTMQQHFRKRLVYFVDQTSPSLADTHMHMQGHISTQI